MIKKYALFLFVGVLLLGWAQPVRPQGNANFPRRPKLVVVLVIDQFRYDYLMRFRPYFASGGFNRLLNGGAVFTDCRYDYATTITGPGHASLLTGTYPYAHGIIGNNWYDRDLKREVYCVEDSSTRAVTSGQGPGDSPSFSPQRLTASTLGDELRMASGFRSKAISISLKDRAAILMGGHTPNAAYWYDTGLGRFGSSTYYMQTLPRWVNDFNRHSPTAQYCGQNWHALEQGPVANGKIFSDFKSAAGESCPDAKYLAWLDKTPFMTPVELAFATQAIRSERLGQGKETDLLTISLSVNDYIGHGFGPYSDEVADTTVRTDRYLAAFFQELDKLVGLDNVWIALSADHGAAPSPNFVQEHKLGIGMAQTAKVKAAAENALTEAFGPGPWIADQDETYLFLDRDMLKKRGVSPSKAEEIAAQAAASQPDVAAAFTRTQILAGNLPDNAIARKVSNSFNSRRSGDVFLVYMPFAVPTTHPSGTTHGTPWNYDTQVPLIFWGSAFKSGIYTQPCQPVDLAATFAALLGLTQPSGSQGVPLSFALR